MILLHNSKLTSGMCLDKCIPSVPSVFFYAILVMKLYQFPCQHFPPYYITYCKNIPYSTHVDNRTCNFMLKINRLYYSTY